MKQRDDSGLQRLKFYLKSQLSSQGEDLFYFKDRLFFNVTETGKLGSHTICK